MRVIQSFWFHMCISTVLAVYDISFKIISPPFALKDKANFGFSITYFNKQLFVSAPTADDIGKIFSYDVIEDSISEIEFKLERESPKHTNDYWLGAYLTSGSKYVVTCAPRTIYKYSYKRFYVTKGVCYTFTSSDDVKMLSDMEERHLLNGGVESFGWIIDINNQTNIIAIGSPGIAPGGVEIYENDMSPPRTLIKNIPNLGYGIASGNFLSDTEIIYAISTTYGEYGEGKVFFYDKSLNSSKLLDSGEVGSMYGAVLCASRLGHTRTSLLVGAPTYASNGRYNTGAVYIYVPTEKESNALQNIRILKGTVDGGHFGASIISLGDMDGDGRDEVAIGAPYEGEGAVYIYSGFGLLNNQTWLQQIHSEYFESLGFSLAPIRDDDRKQCTDIGVGAPLSNNALIFKCIPIVTVQVDAEVPNIQKKTIDTEEYYNFKVCLNVLYPQDPRIIRSKIEVKVEMIHAAARLEPNPLEPFEIYLEKRIPRICEDFNFVIFDGNYEDLIKFNLTAKLIPFKKTIFSAPDVVLSDRSVLSLQKSVCAANCKSSCYCVPRLLPLSPKTTLTNPYKVGVKQLERFSIFVENTGETAYDACVVITGSNAFVQRFPPSCSRYNSTGKYVCRPLQNILSGMKWEVGYIYIDTSSLTDDYKNLSIHYDVYGHCENESEKHSETINYELIFDYSAIHISGASNPNKVLNITDDEIESVKKIQHVYTISNKGIIDFNDILIIIKLPKHSYVNYHTPILKLIRVNETLSKKCSSTVKKVKGVINIVCSIDLLKGTQGLLILSIDVLPNKLGEKENNATVLSEVQLLTSYEGIKGRVETKLEIVSISVPKWIWIAAFVAALLILLILFIILHRCGFFKRQHKEKLQSRKRQSEMQSLSQNDSEKDTTKVIEKQE